MIAPVNKGTPPIRRALGVLAGLLAVLAIVAVLFAAGQARRQGAWANACAEQLAESCRLHERAMIRDLVQNPSAAEALAMARHAEIGFVRPVSPEWTRVGMFIRGSTTSTTTEVVALLLKNDPESGCTFVGDFEPGAFSGSTSSVTSDGAD